MDKETATEREREAINDPLAEPAKADTAAPAEPEQTRQPRKNGRRHNGQQPEPVATEWLEEDAIEAAEQSEEADQDTSFASEPGDSLNQIRKLAPWVMLALFAAFPNYVTLAILVLSLALNGPQLWGIVRSMNIEHWGYVGLTLLAGGLRFWDLGLKPLHHDESMHAYFSYLFFLNPSSYQYNPILHGPFQFHAIAYVYYVAHGLGTPDGGVTDVTARIAAATMGTLMIPTCYFLRTRIGKAGALVAAFLLTISPVFVYYSRFTREDIYFASFIFITVVAFFKYAEERRLHWLLIALGAFTGAYATKESAFFNIAIFGGLLGGFIAWELGSRVVYPSARRQDEADALAASQGGPEADDEAAAEPPRRRARLPLGLDQHAGVLAVLLYLLVAGIAAKLVLGWVENTSSWIAATDKYGAANQDQIAAQRLAQAQASSQNIENVLVNVLLVALVVIAIIVLVAVIWQFFTDPYQTPPADRMARRGLARWVDPIRQPLLDGLVRVPWSHWFFGLLVVFGVFAGLFWIVPTNAPGACNGSTPLVQGAICSWTQGFHQGIGDGLVQGIFYWITQQQYARGGQPWYYYLILIPFYEQLIVVFGIGGLIRCLVRPNRFRLFVVVWFVASLFLYSWAGEKMPWLTLHIVLPLLILAAIALEWALARVMEMLDEMAQNRFEGRSAFAGQVLGRSARPLFTLTIAFLLLIPMLHSMLFVTYVDPGDAPHEMLSYVQTTTDVTDVMAKIAALDQQLYGGTHQLRIGLPNSQAIWPFSWYLRDYKNVYYYYDGKNPPPADLDVIITDPGAETAFTAPDATHPQGLFLAHQYRIRAWWDEGYKPPPCVPTQTKPCDPNLLYGGIGVWPWLSYGDPAPCETITTQNQQVAQQLAQTGVVYCVDSQNPVRIAACTKSSQSQTGVNCAAVPSVDFGKAFGNFWDWLWTRQAIGPTDGSTDFMFLVRSGLPMQP
ncbi:MAG TPA: flippase activity-associated protein Agl23 [Ktedonobacterales bacterium]|nr:flippase activity-associated protein Agl23 [Ktedonobacterales bacterium]